MSVSEQLIVLLTLVSGFFDTIPIEKMQLAENEVLSIVTDLPSELLKRLHAGTELNPSDNALILNKVKTVLNPFKSVAEEKQDHN